MDKQWYLKKNLKITDNNGTFQNDKGFNSADLKFYRPIYIALQYIKENW